MKKEIGSIFDIDEKLSGRSLEVNQDFFQRFYGKNQCFVNSGREAIDLALVQLGKSISDEDKVCLLPKYTCDTVIIPFIKHNWTIHYYGTDRYYQIERKSFGELVERVKPAVMLFHTYYGFDTLSPLRDDLREYQKQGIKIIEDMTQSLFLTTGDFRADYYVGSLRKWFPITDGGFLITNEEITDQPVHEKAPFVKDKLEAMVKKNHYLKQPSQQIKQEFLSQNRAAEDFLYEDDSVCLMSETAKYMLNMQNIEENKRLRNENFKYLYEQLNDCTGITIPYKVYEEETAPLYFPIYVVKEREKLQNYLVGMDIYVPVLWPIPPQVEDLLAEEDRYIFEHLLAIPCDQRYNLEDMKRIANAIKDYCSKEGI